MCQRLAAAAASFIDPAVAVNTFVDNEDVRFKELPHSREEVSPRVPHNL